MPVSANGSASGRISVGPLAVDEAVADPSAGGSKNASSGAGGRQSNAVALREVRAWGGDARIHAEAKAPGEPIP